MYTKTMNINFPQDIAEGLTNLSVQMGRPRTKLIFEACKMYLQNSTTPSTPPVNNIEKTAHQEWTPLDFLSSSGTGIR